MHGVRQPVEHTRMPARGPIVLDWVERATVVALFTTLIVSRRDAFGDPDARAFLLLYCASEGLVVGFMLVRRHTNQVSLRVTDWLVAVGATVLPLFVKPGGSHLVPPAVGASLVILGMTTQVSAKLTLRRSIGMVAANRGVKVSGPYQLVRHPMYAGYLLSHVGLFLLSPLWVNALIYSAAWTIQIIRIRAEERLLGTDPKYQDYRGRVRHRLIPGVY